MLFAFSLRSAVASLSPLIDHIAVDFAMPPAIIGLIGTAPPVCYAVFGILTPLFERRLGLERLTVIAIVVGDAAWSLRGFAADAVGAAAEHVGDLRGRRRGQHPAAAARAASTSPIASGS